MRNYTMGDVDRALQTSCGHNVLHPMGWDAFGMPAENAAMKSAATPRTGPTPISTRWRADEAAGLWPFDWSARCSPPATRNITASSRRCFSILLEKGLVYRKNAVVNWDPVDMTVLANEQVIDGKGWRSGAEVERRELTQWFFKISDMADELLDGARWAG